MKRVAETSRAAFAEIAATRHSRGLEVLETLRRFHRQHGIDPTAYELLAWAQVDHPAWDLNSIRPRLTEMKDAGRVETGGKRRCAITHKQVYTWRAISWVSRSPRPEPA